MRFIKTGADRDSTQNMKQHEIETTIDVMRPTETVQETLAKSCYMWKTLAGLAVLLGSCFRRKDEYGFLHSLYC